MEFGVFIFNLGKGMCYGAWEGEQQLVKVGSPFYHVGSRD